MLEMPESSTRLLRTASIILFKMIAISWASISALELISWAPIFLISSEVKEEYRYDAIERPMAIAPINQKKQHASGDSREFKRNNEEPNDSTR
jgi:hypothetical protein